MTVAPSSDELRLGTLVATGVPAASSLPLEQTDVTAQLYGPLASVAVTQRFANPFTKPIELSYRFPLPHEAAIVDYELRIGQRVIRADIQELEAAHTAYDEARRAGQQASLIEQRRPNLFEVTIANVMPNEQIVVTVRYQERLRYDDGDYQFVFPMGLTPKFHADPREAAKVDAPLAESGAPIGPVYLNVSIDAGVALGEPRSPSHQISVTRVDERRCTVQVPGDVLPNKDFVLRYAVAEDALQAAAWATPSANGSTVMVTALPPRMSDDFEPAPREFVFVLDRSGSMQGGPLLQARNALRACLRTLGPLDTFAVLTFDNVIERLSEAALPVTQATVEQADAWLGQVTARGGTDIIGALDAALQLPSDAERQRYVVFLTDGAVSTEEQALRLVEQRLGRTRLFTFGIGPSVNRMLLMRLAEFGHGTAEFLQLNEDIEAAIVRFQDRVAFPVLQDLQLTWQGGAAWDVYPSRLPDLYIGQPLEVVARFKPSGSAPARLLIRGRRGEEQVELAVDLPNTTTVEPSIERAWAQARMTALLDMIRDDSTKTNALRGEIIGLSIEQRVLSPYTAFVAIDSAVANTTGDSSLVQVAVPLPEGLDLSGFQGGGAAAAGGAVLRSISNISRTALSKRSRMQARDSAMPTAAFSPMAMPAPAPEPTPMAQPLGEVLSREEAMPSSSTVSLRDLARSQNVDGSWGQGDEAVERTAVALLAFVRAGHTTRSGHYRRQLAKALKWLLAASGSGVAALARAVALAELAQAIGDANLAQTAQAAQASLPPLSAPPAGTLTTLDALRAAVLLRQVAPVDQALLRGPQAELANLWQAALV